MGEFACVPNCVLSACGSSGGSSTAVPAPAAAAPATLQGVFSDAPVAGLSYTTSSGGSGTTDGLGTFNYAAGAIANTMTDNIAVSYLAGSGASYSLSVGPANCAIAGRSGSIVDANSGNASAYPTVAITCN